MLEETAKSTCSSPDTSAKGRDTFLALGQAECEAAFPTLGEKGVKCSSLTVGWLHQCVHLCEFISYPVLPWVTSGCPTEDLRTPPAILKRPQNSWSTFSLGEIGLPPIYLCQREKYIANYARQKEKFTNGLGLQFSLLLESSWKRKRDFIFSVSII